MNRRGFLVGIAGAWAALPWRAPKLRPAVPRVEAETSLFYAPPDGQRVLVRFRVHGTDAPAGRLRVYDARRSLLGTAGVLPVGNDHLYGELWVPVAGDRRLASELSVPGARPLWSSHSIEPGPRWVVHVLAIVDPTALLQRLNGLPPMRRAVETAALQALPIRGNPVGPLAPALLDHLPLLRLGSAAHELERAYGIRMSAVAAGPPALFDAATVPLALNGSGTRHAVLAGDGAGTSMTSPDGSVVSVAPAGLVADMASLQMATGGDGMARAVERWLRSLAPAWAPPRTAAWELSAFAVGTEADDIGMLAVRTAEEWNARYAFPRIVLDGTPPPLEAFSRPGAVVAGSPGSATGVPPTAAARVRLGNAVAARLAERSRRSDAMVASLASAMRIADPTLAGVGSRLATPMAGTLVFNPTPFTRSDLARFPDGTERLVTDVPGNGYAFVPEVPGEAATWEDAPSGSVAEGSTFRVELDGDTGGIRSLVSRANQTEWVRPGGVLNDLPAARATGVARVVLPGVATKLIAQRTTAGGERVRSTVTVYQGLPWVDVCNEGVQPGTPIPETSFSVGQDVSLVEWEVPAGSLEAMAPVECAWLRWLRLSGDKGSVLFGGLESPLATVRGDGLVVLSPAGDGARYRLAVQPAGGDRYREDPWRHGWSLEPFLSAPVPGTGRIGLPSFGGLLETSDPGAAIVGLEPQRDYSVIVYVQELIGFSRTVAVRSAVLRFGDARLTDFVGRDRAPLDTTDGEVRLDLRARSVAAIKLLDLGVRAA